MITRICARSFNAFAESFSLWRQWAMCTYVCVPLLTRPCMRMWVWVCVDVDSPTRMYWNCLTANSNRCVHAILFCTHRCSSSISCQLYWKFEGTHIHGAYFAQVPSESCVCVFMRPLNLNPSCNRRTVETFKERKQHTHAYARNMIIAAGGLLCMHWRFSSLFS